MTSLKNILSIILVSGIFVLHPSLNKGDTPITYLQYFVYGNSLNIATNNDIDKNLLEVRWVGSEQKTPHPNVIVFKHGKQVNDIPSEKGNQKLIVFYNNKKIGEVPQNKTSKQQAHQYQIELLSKNNSLFFKGDIVGPSPYNGSPVTIASL